MNTSKYYENLHLFKQQIMDLPISELKYHLYILWQGLGKSTDIETQIILEKAIHFTQSYHNFTTEPIEFNRSFYTVKDSFNELITVSETHTYETKVLQQLLNISGIFLGTVLGVSAGIIGGIGGFARGHWIKDFFKSTFQGSPLGLFYGLKSTTIGFFTGLFLGAAVGHRSPQVLFDPIFRQIKFAIDGLSWHLPNVPINTINFYSPFKEQAKELLLTQFFENSVKPLEDYINAAAVTFEIGTYPAEFLDPSLCGFVGHHGFIRVPIQNKYLVLEFTPSPTDVTQPPIQSEMRTVSGEKVLELLAFHLSLLETDTCDWRYIVTTLKPGITDCLSYVNKLLLGTSQEPTSLRRFHKSDTYIGFYVVKPCIERLSPYPAVLGQGQDLS